MKKNTVFLNNKYENLRLKWKTASDVSSHAAMTVITEVL